MSKYKVGPAAPVQYEHGDVYAVGGKLYIHLGKHEFWASKLEKNEDTTLVPANFYDAGGFETPVFSMEYGIPSKGRSKVLFNLKDLFKELQFKMKEGEIDVS